MSQLGDRIGVFQALAFATLLTAVLAFAILLAVRQTARGLRARVRTSRGGC